MIEIKNLTKKFESVYAVKDLNFQIDTGAVVGFLGPNGAGKTTTMRLISGYLEPTRGEILIDGQSISQHKSTLQRRIGYMPETNPLYPNMLVSETLNFVADLKAIPKNNRPEAFDFVVNAVALNEVFYKPAGELSKGFKQRLGLALALLGKPEILLLDEPTEGLDPNQRNDIRTLIKELGKERTIIMSTHVMQEAQAICDRLIVIANGGLVADGSTADLIKQVEGASVIEFDIEGQGVETKLKALPFVLEVKTSSVSQHTVGTVTVNKNEYEKLPPALANLVRENNWTIWTLVEKEEKLEDVFYKLTH